MAELMLSDLIAEVTKLGGDPTTTVVAVMGEPMELVTDESCMVYRLDGRLIADIRPDWEDDDD